MSYCFAYAITFRFRQRNSANVNSVSGLIEHSPMTRFQLRSIMLCVVINMLDGFDVLVMAFTASSVAAEWQVSSTALGVLLSAGLLGMVAGSLVLGPLGDRLGRRGLILWCLVIITIGMLWAGLSQGVNELAAARALTGLGIGGMLPGLNTMVSEYSSLRWRSFWVSLLQTGYPIGATVGGILSAILIAAYGWRAPFLMGAASSLLLIPLVWWHLPESLDFLTSRRPANALAQVNRVLARLGRPAVNALPAPTQEAATQRSGYACLLADHVQLRHSLYLSLAFFVMMLTFYFVMSWTPKILVDSGLSTGQGISGGVLLNVGGIVGSLLLGYLSARLPLARMISVYALLAIVLMLLFSRIGTEIDYLMTAAVALGFVLFGCMIGLYAMAPRLFPTQSRAAGLSLAIGIGRVGAVCSPLLAGWLFDLGWAKPDGYIVFALPLIAVIIVVEVLGRRVHLQGAP